MDAQPMRLEVALDVAADVSPAELDALTTALRRELLRLDIAGVSRPSAGHAPSDARGVDFAALGQLVVELGNATPVLGEVIEVIRAWAARSPQRSARLTIGGDTLELSGLSERDQHALIRDWMARHPQPSSL